jgi:hypothetical protein
MKSMPKGISNNAVGGNDYLLLTELNQAANAIWLLNRNKNVVIPGRLKAEPGIQESIENTGFRITAARFQE